MADVQLEVVTRSDFEAEKSIRISLVTVRRLSMDGFTQTTKKVGGGKLRGKAREITCSLAIADSRGIIINNNDYSFPLDLTCRRGMDQKNRIVGKTREHLRLTDQTTTMAGHLFHRSYWLYCGPEER